MTARRPGDRSADDVRRSAFVAVAGRPNAGKSTLINQLVGSHVAIVSPIAQTTRRIVRAALTAGDTQLVFVDLPGSQKPVDRLTARMQTAVEGSLGDVDCIAWVVDMGAEARTGERIVADMVFATGLPVVIVANKVDTIHPTTLAQRIHKLAQIIADREYHALIPVSAKSGDGCDVLVRELSSLAPEGAEFFPEGAPTTDMRESERVSEYVREAALAYLREELPHAMVVDVDEMFDDPDSTPPRLHIECTIFVENDSQAGIIVGKGGQMIRSIGEDARKRIERELGERVYLHLRAKVRRRWRDDDVWLAGRGL
jgi:GTP-binding protein Era